MGTFREFCNKAALTAQVVANKYQGSRARTFRSRVANIVTFLFLGAWALVLIKLGEIFQPGLGIGVAVAVSAVLVYALRKRILAASRRFGRRSKRTAKDTEDGDDDEEDGDE